MKKMILMGALAAVVAVCFCLTGCGEDGYSVPTKTGGGGKSQPFLPAGNKGGGQFIHLDKK